MFWKANETVSVVMAAVPQTEPNPQRSQTDRHRSPTQESGTAVATLDTCDQRMAIQSRSRPVCLSVAMYETIRGSVFRCRNSEARKHKTVSKHPLRQRNDGNEECVIQPLYSMALLPNIVRSDLKPKRGVIRSSRLHTTSTNIGE